MHKGTYLIAAVLFCTAALAACGAKPGQHGHPVFSGQYG